LKKGMVGGVVNFDVICGWTKKGVVCLPSLSTYIFMYIMYLARAYWCSLLYIKDKMTKRKATF